METYHLIIVISGPSILFLITIIYLAAGLYVHRRREYQELFAQSPGILILSIELNYIHTASSITLGFLYSLGIERDKTICFPVMIIYCLSRHALYISTILKIYRLGLINQVRSGVMDRYDVFLQKKERLSDSGNLKVLIIYTLSMSAIFVAIFCFEYAYKVTESLDDGAKETFHFWYTLFWISDTIGEEICYAIYIWKIKQVKNVGLVKTELILYMLIGSVGIAGPFLTNEEFFICILPIRNLVTMLVTITITNFHSRKKSIIPLPNLKDSRLVLENYNVYETFRNFVTKSKNKTWLYLLNLLVAISVFRINNTNQRALEIYSQFFKNKKILPDWAMQKVENELLSNEKKTNVEVDFFLEIEGYIFDYFDQCVYPEYCKSNEYIKMNQEMEVCI